MQPVTLPKVLLIAIVIGLGAALGSVVPANSTPMHEASAINVPTSKATGPLRTKRPMSRQSGHEFVEQTPFPYLATSAPLHCSSSLEYEN